MSRNVNSFFSEAPQAHIERSRFRRPQKHITSFDVGECVPFFVDEILPGDSVSIDTSKVVRMSTLIAPLMDNIYLDTYFFFVPRRLVWEHWKQFMGENTQSAWIPEVSYSIPQVTSPEGGWQIGTIADYMGVPTGVEGLSFDACYFRAYALVMNEWFRDENLTDPIYFSVGDATVVGSNGYDYRNDIVKGGKPFKAAKYKDYFTSALPSPQKGSDVVLPLGDMAPVYAGNIDTSSYSTQALHFASTGLSSGVAYPMFVMGQTSTDGYAIKQSSSGSASGGYQGLRPSNLMADLSLATGSSINQLRTAFQVQKFYERDARGGTRYTELIQSHFNVHSPDGRLQRPEYLGGTRVPINIHQVVQSSGTDSVSPQGNTAAYSLTIDSHSDFTKSFTEHGILLGICVARYDHTYQQGLNRIFSRKLREDFYFPVFASLGEQAIRNKELYAQGTSQDDEVFGYQEAWAEYRYLPNRVSGMMRSQYSQSLDFWHLADYYDTLPSLSDDWIREDKTPVDRTLAVTSSVAHQFIADIFVNAVYVRPMPLYSIPGLIDHH